MRTRGRLASSSSEPPLPCLGLNRRLTMRAGDSESAEAARRRWFRRERRAEMGARSGWSAAGESDVSEELQLGRWSSGEAA